MAHNINGDNSNNDNDNDNEDDNDINKNIDKIIVIIVVSMFLYPFPYDLLLHSFSLCPQPSICARNLKSLSSRVTRRIAKIESTSRYPILDPL